MKIAEITYTTDGIGKMYAKAIRFCPTVADLLKELTENWSELCPDALKQAERISEADWKWVRKHARDEDGKTAQRINDLAGAILMPETLLRATLIAQQHYVPEGLAHIRMQQAEPKP